MSFRAHRQSLVSSVRADRSVRTTLKSPRLALHVRRTAQFADKQSFHKAAALLLTRFDTVGTKAKSKLDEAYEKQQTIAFDKQHKLSVDRRTRIISMSEKAPEHRTRGQQLAVDRRPKSGVQASLGLQASQGQLRKQLGQHEQPFIQEQSDNLALSSRPSKFQGKHSAQSKATAQAIPSKQAKVAVQHKQTVQSPTAAPRGKSTQRTPNSNQQITKVVLSAQSKKVAQGAQNTQRLQQGKRTSSLQNPQRQNIKQVRASGSTGAVTGETHSRNIGRLANANLNVQGNANLSAQVNANTKAQTDVSHNDAQSVFVVHSQGQLPKTGRWQKPQSVVELAQVKKASHEHANEAKQQIDVTDNGNLKQTYVLSADQYAAQLATQLKDDTKNRVVQGGRNRANLAQGVGAVTNRATNFGSQSAPLAKERSKHSVTMAERHIQKQNKAKSSEEQRLSNHDAVNSALDIQTPRRVHSKFRQRPHIPKGRRRFVHISLWKWCLAIFLLILLAAGGVAYKGYSEFKTIGSYVVPAQSEPYELKDGATVSTVVHNLAGQRYHSLLLDLWVKFNHFNYPVIQKGPYLVDGQKTLSQLLTDMCEGNIIKLKLPTVALIEGMTAAMVKKRLLANRELVQDPQLSSIFASPSYFIERTLVKDARDVTLLEAIGGTHNSLEGLLMPATYEYVKDQYTTLYLVEKALIKMANFMREHYIERNHVIDDVISSPYEVLILASLVERESSLDSERPLIAGVFLNRLRAKIKLQTDPAVMYGVSPEFKGPLRLSQLKKDTPYNTYTRIGLPPTPIAMPSEGAILAVLNPSETDYLFFVAKGPDPKDGHYFSSTLKEHNRAVKQYRKAVQEYKRTAQDKKAVASSSSQNQDILVHETQSDNTVQSNLDKQENVSGNSAVEFNIQ